MELSINNYIDFLSLQGSMWGWVIVTLFFILIAQFRPFMIIALMCFYPTLFWSASWKPAFTLYPIYPLLLFLGLKYINKILMSFMHFRYKPVVLLSAILILWSFFSPLLYPAQYGPPITFSMNPNYQRGIIMLAILFLIPTVLPSRKDLYEFVNSFVYVFMGIHLFVMLISIVFLLSGQSLLNLHLMRILDTPPVYWESGLLLIGLAYFFVKQKISPAMLIVFCIFACFGLILGNSRTRFLATFLCLIYFIYPYISRRLVAWTVVLMFILSASLLALPKVTGYFYRLIDQRVEQSVGKSFTEMATGRVSAYEFAYKRWKQRPFIGVGSCYILPRASAVNKIESGPMPRVHNYYLEVLAGQGVVGFMLLSTILLISAKMVVKIIRVNSKKAMEGRILISLFLFGLVNWFLKESWGITYSMIVLLSVYSQTGETQLSENLKTRVSQ